MLIRRLFVATVFFTIAVAGLKLAGVPIASVPDYIAATAVEPN